MSELVINVMLCVLGTLEAHCCHVHYIIEPNNVSA